MCEEKILLTGATGYIGQKLSQELLQNGCDVYVIVRKESDISSICQFLPDSHIIVFDEKTGERLDAVAPDVLINLAGKFVSVHNPGDVDALLNSNIIFPAKICEFAYHSGCKKFINAGSYWQNYDNEEYNPVNYYAATKEAMKKILQYYALSKECKVMTLKIFDSYGDGDPRNKILNILSRLEDGDSIGMTGGEQKMFFCHVDDIVSAFLTAITYLEQMERGTYEEFFLRGEKAVCLKNIVEKFLQVTGKKINIRWGERTYHPKEIFDPDRIGTGKVLPGWKCNITMEDGLNKAFCQKGEL